ncbi:MAG: hypothetical protein WCO00_05545 [Rhodospirillaceae bacterium]
MKSRAGLACLGVFAAVSMALPVLAGGGLLPWGGGDRPLDTGLTAPGIGFIKIEPGDTRNSVTPTRQYRFDTGLFSAIEPYASVKPWLGSERTPGRQSFGVGGILVDVPLGDFVFTPSFSAGRYAESTGRDRTAALQFRSSLELGYRFEDQSRFSLGYSHTTNTAQTLSGPIGGNALSISYRIPSDWLLGP